MLPALVRERRSYAVASVPHDLPRASSTNLADCLLDEIAGPPPRQRPKSATPGSRRWGEIFSFVTIPAIIGLGVLLMAVFLIV